MTGRKHSLLGKLLVAATVLWAGPAGARQVPTQMRTVTDETGRGVRVPLRIERVVSLAPNLTEMVYALGLEKRLVGVTNQCDYPAAAREKPKVGDVINPSLERIIELNPDVVLGTTAGNRRETVEALDGAGIALYGVDPHSVQDIFVSIRHVAELLDAPEAGEALTARLRARLSEVSLWPGKESPPRVLFVLWLEPLLSAGNDTFLNDVLSRAGAESITARIKQNWPRLSIEEVIQRDPDYLILPRSLELESRLARLTQQPPWKKLRAVQQGHIIWLDDSVLRPGPRIVEVIADLARQLHPPRLAGGEVVRP